MSKRIAIYPGSFDPITNGHLDVIQRAARLFDEVIVALAHNAEKQPMFSVAERRRMIEQSVRRIPSVRVDDFKGLLVEYARKQRATVILRGLRAVSDFEFEFQMALMNRRLEGTVETVFMMPKDEYTFLSSRLIKEIVRFGGDATGLVPKEVAAAMRRKIGRRR